ncbi:MAG: ATP-binding protein [Candidatus Aminicenantes bacterium]|nr:MAG: ATP-binding protein [Candidatus Aminicenantes bacterium]
MRIDADESLRCWCDRRGLYRVLRNLVDNAIKYNHRGGWVEIRAYGDAGVPVFEVEDNGEGIPAAELKAVLQRFYRVDRARTPGDGGLGLGLAIVKHMVQALGGSLDLDSREDVGTPVTVRLLPPPDGEV